MKFRILAGCIGILVICVFHLDRWEINDFSLRRVRDVEGININQIWESGGGVFKTNWDTLSRTSYTWADLDREFRDPAGTHHQLEVPMGITLLDKDGMTIFRIVIYSSPRFSSLEIKMPGKNVIKRTYYKSTRTLTVWLSPPFYSHLKNPENPKGIGYFFTAYYDIRGADGNLYNLIFLPEEE